MGLFDGLSKFGIKDINTSDIYKEEKEQEAKNLVEVPSIQVVEVAEKDYVFAKTYTCPVCDNQFKSLSLKSNKAKMISMDRDLRPLFDGVEPLKYEAVCCTRCGYSVMSKFLCPLTPSQKKPIMENISQNFGGITEDEEVTSFEDALEKIRLALMAAVLKRAKSSEKAYICLKGGWLCRAYLENLTPADQNYLELKDSLAADEKEFLDNAYEGFMTARSTENFPIAGMDSVTLDYLLAVLAIDREQFDVASKLVAGILQNRTSSKIKDKALDLRDELVQKIKMKKNQ